MFVRICTSCAALAIAVTAIAFLAAPAAEAKGIRFVASNGDDANDCQRKQPCRTLQRGVDSAPDGGAVVVVDPAKYGGTVTINKSITIEAVPGEAVVDGIVFNAPGASVVLRGLTLNGLGLPPGSSGIVIVAAASIQILACQVERFDEDGIRFEGEDADVFIANTVVRYNNQGLFLPGGTAGNRVTIGNSRFENNASHGFFLQGASDDTTVERVVVFGNNTGLQVHGTARVSSSVVVNNGTGMHNNGGTLLSRENNTVDGNGNDTQGTITPLSPI